MVRQLLPWRSIAVIVFFLVSAAFVSAATHFVGWKSFGTGLNRTWYWNPTNVIINAGDTVMWTNLGNIHSVNPGTNSSEPFCGTGTNEITSCTVTFQNQGT